MKTTSNCIAKGLCIILMAGVPLVVSAQVEAGLEEIVVTAQRTASKAQDTPIAMSVYNQTNLADAGINNIGDLAKNDPSLRITGTWTTNITIRGITSTNDNETGDPTVPVAFDDFYTNRPLVQYGGLYDVDRVEVLRGPQGTLFGRNVVGGVVSVYSAKPKDHFEASGSLDLGNYNAININGMLNFPLTNTVWMRASATSVSHDGYRSLSPANARGDDADSKSARLQFAFHPSEAFDGNLLFQTTRVGGVGPVNRQISYRYYQLDPKNPTQVIGGAPMCVAPFLPTCEPDHSMPPGTLDDPSHIQSIVASEIAIRDFTVRLRMDYHFANAISVSYLGGYDSLDWFNPTEVSRRDGTQSGREAFGLPGTDVFSQHQKPRTWNHELRLVGDPSNRLTWQAGLFVFSERNDVFTQRINQPYTVQAIPWLKFVYPDVKDDSKAVYGHLTYQLTDTLKLSAGARYTKDSKSRDGDIILPLIPSFVPAHDQPQHGSEDNGQSTWHVGVDWKPNPDTLIYAKADKGYKAGGYTNIAQFKPEILVAYEAGLKTTFTDRVQVNVAAFDNNFKDQQVLQLGSNILDGALIKNAGKSQIYGLELDVNALVGTNSKLGFHATYAHGQYKDFVVSNAFGTCPLAPGSPDANPIQYTAPSCNTQLAGNTTIQTPKLSLSANAEHTFDLGGGATLTPSIDARFSSKSYFSPYNYDDSVLDPYTIVDIGAKYVPAQGTWDLNLYVRNVADKIYLADAYEQQISGIETYNTSFSPPRTYGARINYRWK